MKRIWDRIQKGHTKQALSFIAVIFSLPFASVFVSRPTGLRTSNITTTSVRVEWNPVQERFILGYKVLVQNFPLNQTLPWNKTYALVAGLLSNTKYIISVLPVHGLTLEEHSAGNTASITVTTKREPGKKKFEGCSSYIVSTFRKVHAHTRIVNFFCIRCQRPWNYSWNFSKIEICLLTLNTYIFHISSGHCWLLPSVGIPN